MYALMPEKDVVAQTTMLQAFAHNGVVEKATKIFDVILDKDERSMYGKCRSLLDAVTVFDRADCDDHGLWKQPPLPRGIQALAGMDLEGVEANHVGVSPLGEANQASLHSQKLFVQMFARCGSLPGAEAVFRQIPPHVTSYDAMVAAYPRAGEAQAAIRTFELMNSE
ncbi:pentatricopeptide repeat-containing protein DOT4, chloroplastic-like [Selaginella moellendorffii]|uniref:pentatricopeptide repeat-containing protein DOT4, chloroplastic-like n=1 Tax=Selaginella moellendorffii TaxID=88036 RepID=UPI000D1CB7F3|nr:pentatricopeptide repeat-containing protein DOT4, chloroplastic-like [Selaginella moellendorffii]|eukprot:XP_024540717.1 pentatricopeptide repeat-containing protein DOT4, chloroplastic-like [Selaginella moellendorffii]